MSFRVSSLLETLSQNTFAANPPAETTAIAVESETSSSISDGSESAKGDAPRVINFRELGAYTLKLEGGFGWRDFQNERRLDHSGAMFRAGGGLRFDLGQRVSLSPRLFYEFQYLRNFLSHANVHTAGLELDLGVAVHSKWFSVHPTVGMGAAIYRSDNQEGSFGARFNDNSGFWPIHSSGARIELGLQLCTWSDAFCLGARFAGDIGVNPELNFPNGSSALRMGLSPWGPTVSGGVDVLRIVHNIRKRKEPVERSSAAALEIAVSAAPAPEDEEANSSVAGAEVSGKRPPSLQPTLSIADFEKGLEEVRELHKWTGYYLSDAEKALMAVKNPKMSRSDKQINAESAIAFYRRSLDKMREAQVILAGLASISREIVDPDEQARVSEIMKEASGLLTEISSRTMETHGLATESTHAYNKKRGSQPAMKFEDSKPEILAG